jgi:DnaJ homolog subfamily B member 4
VLSDAGKRAVYDQYGEEGLRDAAPQPGGGGADDIFAEFFGSTPFTYCNATAGGGGAGGSKARVGGRKQPPPPPPAWDSAFGRAYSRGDQSSAVECRLTCTLEELYVGVTKKMRISRNVVDATG